MVEAPSLVLAFAAGFVSFLSPCCLPLVPGYLAAVCGVAPGEQRARIDAGVLWRSLAFVATFSLIFVLLETCFSEALAGGDRDAAIGELVDAVKFSEALTGAAALHPPLAASDPPAAA